MKHESSGEWQRIGAGCVFAVAFVTGLALASCHRKESSAEKAADTPVAATAREPPSPTDLPEAQLQQAGQGVATTGVTSAGVPPCTSCHGQQGEGNAAAGFPRIAGHPRAYVEEQLDAFADGRRPNPIMQPIAKNLSQAQRHAVAAYYSMLEPTQTAAAPKVNAQDAQRAAKLSAVGDDARQLQACANCHGPDGRGAPPRYPPLAGQHASYLANALNEWRSSRNTDASGQMPAIAKALKDDEIQALAQYFAAQPAPPPAGRREAAPVAADGGTAGGPSSDAAPPQGVGSEQGMPVTGVTQGRQNPDEGQGGDRQKPDSNGR